MKALRNIMVTIAAIALSACSAGNLEEVKANSAKTFSDNGFRVVGYHGYQWGFWGFNDYGGARVWYTLRKGGSDITYEAALQKWGDEYHLYSLKAKDAIQP